MGEPQHPTSDSPSKVKTDDDPRIKKENIKKPEKKEKKTKAVLKSVPNVFTFGSQFVSYCGSQIGQKKESE